VPQFVDLMSKPAPNKLHVAAADAFAPCRVSPAAIADPDTEFVASALIVPGASRPPGWAAIGRLFNADPRLALAQNGTPTAEFGWTAGRDRLPIEAELPHTGVPTRQVVLRRGKILRQPILQRGLSRYGRPGHAGQCSEEPAA
jgi:hypothetical protein